VGVGGYPGTTYRPLSHSFFHWYIFNMSNSLQECSISKHLLIFESYICTKESVMQIWNCIEIQTLSYHSNIALMWYLIIVT